MVRIIFKTGKVTDYVDADEIKSEQNEYIILNKSIPVGQIPRENVEQIMFAQSLPKQ